jgi:hypothetical protein
MLKENVIHLAETMNIAWDYDPSFMSISMEITGKSLLSEMSEDELKTLYSFIENNPHLFARASILGTKEAEIKVPAYFKSNEDYNGDFLDKIKKRLRSLRETSKNRSTKKSLRALERKV